jgi:IMP dehydrogenase
MVQDEWIAVGLKEAKYLYDTWYRVLESGFKLDDFVPHLCIDQANGHMKELLNLCRDFKRLLGKDGIKIMTGNIANPQTYYEYAIHGVDYVRVSVGSGHGCTTSCQTGFHYPMGTLLVEINKMKEQVTVDLMNGVIADNCIYTLPKVVADGGFSTNEQIIKALALGADYVMLGEIIGRSKEACGTEYLLDKEWGDFEDDYVEKNGRLYYGMSTERAQIAIHEASYFKNNEFILKRAEGIEKVIPIEYGIGDWLKNFNIDLRSAMSYANAKSLKLFIGRVKWDTISYDSRMKFMGKLEK